MAPVIPHLDSRYIPVHNHYYALNYECHWWKSTSSYLYPNVLINLMEIKKEELNLLKQDNPKDLFLLTDSGGFQILNGTCNLNWETSLLKQIELGASKIFSLDTPPVKLVKGTLNQFIKMEDMETKRIIKENFEVALKQSAYLKEKYPEDFKRFCYVAQTINKSDLDYNISLFDEIGGEEHYSEYFPGGIVYTTKTSDTLMIAMAARHAYEHFIKKGIYVHYLGMGSFNRFLILIRNKISTFDSSSALQGVRTNMFINPVNFQKAIQLKSDNFLLEKQFCNCPVCSKVNYNSLIEKEEYNVIGRNFIKYNLWMMLQLNILLDAVPLELYTSTVNILFNIKPNINQCLEFCDYADKNGFDIAYEKYKPFLKKDQTKQKTLF